MVRYKESAQRDTQWHNSHSQGQSGTPRRRKPSPECKKLQINMTGGHLSLNWSLLTAAIMLGFLGMHVRTGNTTEWNTEVTSPATEGSTSQTPTASEASSVGSFSPSQLDTSSQPTTTANRTTEQGLQGLSSGEAAGVAVGTIAGVAALGEAVCINIPALWYTPSL
ncbi:hypothetical protein SKAU_G00330190 [Synaphobranchus kaupii]|uniref:Uncharacterized protein n=1 Tax=Synaphobranchus kaupii TaxID=118154 RepID=A0A9Q1EQI5_SYNKA|nr:hypothetical protein SKAU_G00330190 [Synaphobranchus kaupii]